jgi:hypothetical protein
MLGPGGIFAERHRGMWLLLCGSSWMLLFVYGTIKFLWMREWGYACATGGVIALGPLGVALTLWNRGRRERAAAAREANEAALEALLDRAERAPRPEPVTRATPAGMSPARSPEP